MRSVLISIPLCVLGVLLSVGCVDQPGQEPVVFQVTTTSLPAGKAGEAYSAELGATGGASPYTWKISEGTLPKGLFLSAAGKITGRPKEGCNPSFTILVADGSTAQKTATRVMGLVIEPETLAVTAERFPDGKVGRYFGEQLAAKGGVPPYTWTASALPEGLKFSSRGYLSGTPKAEAMTEITFTVADSRNHTAEGRITLTVKRGMSEALIAKVCKEAFDEQFETIKSGGNINAMKSYDNAAKANGFKDYRDFCEKGAKWNANKFSAVLKEAVEDFTKRVNMLERERSGEGGRERPRFPTRKRIAYYQIHQPDVNYPNDDVIIWKAPDRENRAFLLSPGTKVDVIETVDGSKYGTRHIMYKIRTADGRTGWVPKRWCKQFYK
jgi:hypothetical protein